MKVAKNLVFNPRIASAGLAGIARYNESVILVIDNYDSFTYNLVQYVGQCGAEVVVKRNDKVSVDEILALQPDGIMLSPGPCTPGQSGVCLDLMTEATQGDALKDTPVFGVCLGHQVIGEVAGGKVEQARTIMHGKTSMIRHDGLGLFHGVPNPFRAVRYHSLIVSRDTVPRGFIVTANSEDDGEVMGLRHTERPIEGVQFHPESVLTESGMQIIENFVRLVRGRLGVPSI